MDKPTDALYTALDHRGRHIITVLAADPTAAHKAIMEQLERNPSRSAYIAPFKKGGCKLLTQGGDTVTAADYEDWLAETQSGGLGI